MYYFKHIDNKIEKYNVNFKKEQLIKLKIDVINKCSEIIHKEIYSPLAPNTKDYLKIRNLIKKEINITSEKKESNEVLYYFSYDEYIYPYLVTLINKLLAGDASVIDQIFAYQADDIELLNKKSNEIAQYYYKLQSLISFELIDTITLGELSKNNNSKTKRKTDKHARNSKK